MSGSEVGESSSQQTGQQNGAQEATGRRQSMVSESSQTAREYIESQLQLEADARQALPYSFDSCTQPLGPLRQTLFACLTCNPPSTNPDEPYRSAAVCYSCSISCHGEHTLVELFNKRNFVCDCGTTRFPSSAPCTLRSDPQTGEKAVHSQEPAPGNRYNKNFQNRFCGCNELYDADKEKGTMYQCLGLGTTETGGCGEDWWHPECLIGLPRDWNETVNEQAANDGGKEIEENGNAKDDGDENAAEEETPLPPGFPEEDDFVAFICYKCVESNPWLRRYAGTPGFLPPVFKSGGLANKTSPPSGDAAATDERSISKKRKAGEDQDPEDEQVPKRPKAENPDAQPDSSNETKSDPGNPGGPKYKHEFLPSTAPSGVFSLFLKEDFRDHLCRCPTCFPNLASHPQLREEEDTYEPPLSDDGNEPNGGGSTGTGSLLERGEAALSNIDRVRAIEGAMVYNHLRDKVKEFLKPYAESGKPVSAEDIKSYFEQLRGDYQDISKAGNDSDE